MVKCLKIEFVEDIMADVTRLPQESEKWAKDLDLCLARAQFTLHDDPSLDIDKKKGTSKVSLSLEFIEPTAFIIQYFTYDRCYKYFHGLHFKIMSHLQYNNRMVNLPNFLCNIVKKKASLVLLGKDLVYFT